MNIHISYLCTVTWGWSAKEPEKTWWLRMELTFKKSISTASGLFMSISKAKKRNISRVKSLEKLFFPIKQRFGKGTVPSNINPCLRTAINNNKKLVSAQLLKHEGYMSLTRKLQLIAGVSRSLGFDSLPLTGNSSSFLMNILCHNTVVPLLLAHTECLPPHLEWGSLRHLLQVITSHLRGRNHPVSLT